jgi:hypothetical protein
MGMGALSLGKSSQGIANHSLQLVPTSRKRGSIHPLPHTFSYRGAELVKYRDNFTLTQIIMNSKLINILKQEE